LTAIIAVVKRFDDCLAPTAVGARLPFISLRK